jgi:hypothetical protein
VNIETATASDIYSHLLHVQDRVTELLAEDCLALARDAEQNYGTAQRAVGQVLQHLDEARQILAVLETRDHRPEV